MAAQTETKCLLQIVQSGNSVCYRLYSQETNFPSTQDNVRKKKYSGTDSRFGNQFIPIQTVRSGAKVFRYRR